MPSNNREHSEADAHSEIRRDALDNLVIKRGMTDVKADLRAIGVMVENEYNDTGERNLRTAYLLDGFRYLNDASYRALIELSKGRLTVKDILGKEELQPLVDLVSRAAAIIEIDREKFLSSTDPRLDPKKPEWFISQLVVLSRIYAPDKGITIVRPGEDGESKEYYDPASVTGIMIADAKIDVKPIGANPVKALTFNFGGTASAALVPGASLTLGSSGLTLEKALGNTIPEPLRRKRDVDLKIKHEMVSRASLKVSLDPTATKLTIVDCGTRNSVSVLTTEGGVKYDPGANQSGIMSPEEVAELRRKGLIQ